MNFVKEKTIELSDYLETVVFKGNLKGNWEKDQVTYDLCSEFPPSWESSCSFRLGCQNPPTHECGSRRVYWHNYSGWVQKPSSIFFSNNGTEEFRGVFDELGNNGIPVQRIFVSFLIGDGYHLSFPERQVSRKLEEVHYNAPAGQKCSLINGTNKDLCYNYTSFVPSERPYWKVANESKKLDFVIFFDSPNVSKDLKIFLSEVLIVNDRVSISTFDYFEGLDGDMFDKKRFRFLSDENINEMISFVERSDTSSSKSIGDLLRKAKDIHENQSKKIGNELYVVIFLADRSSIELIEKKDYPSGVMFSTFSFQRDECNRYRLSSGGGIFNSGGDMSGGGQARQDSFCVEIYDGSSFDEEKISFTKQSILCKTGKRINIEENGWFMTLPYLDMFDQVEFLNSAVLMKYLQTDQDTKDAETCEEEYIDDSFMMIGIDLDYGYMKENYCQNEDDLFIFHNSKTQEVWPLVVTLPFMVISLCLVLCSSIWMNEMKCMIMGTEIVFLSSCISYMKDNMILVITLSYVLEIVCIIFLNDFVLTSIIFSMLIFCCYGIIIILSFNITFCTNKGRMKKSIKELSEEEHSSPPSVTDIRDKFASSAPLRRVGIRVDMKIMEGLYGDGVCGDYFVSVQSGEMVGIVGHSSAGKSTLFRVLLSEQRGKREILIETKERGDVRYTQDADPIQSVIGYVPQENWFSHHMTIGEQIRFICRYYGRSMKMAKCLLKLLQIESTWNSYPSKISGGQKRRFMLLKELIKEKSIYLLDEVTSGLDGSSTIRTLEILKYVAYSWNVGIVVIIHQPSHEALNLFDRMYLVLKLEGKNEVRELQELEQDPFARLIPRFNSRFHRDADNGEEREKYDNFTFHRFNDGKKSTVAICREFIPKKLLGEVDKSFELDRILNNPSTIDVSKIEAFNVRLLTDYFPEDKIHRRGACEEIWRGMKFCFLPIFRTLFFPREWKKAAMMMSRMCLEELRDSAQSTTQLFVAVVSSFLILFVFNAVHPFEGVSPSYFKYCIEVRCGDLRVEENKCSSIDVVYGCSLPLHNPMFFLVLILNLGIGLIGIICGTYFFSNHEKVYLVQEFRSGLSSVQYLVFKYIVKIPRNISVVLVYFSFVYFAVYFKGSFIIPLVDMFFCFYIVFNIGIVFSLLLKNAHAIMYGTILILIMNLYSGIFVTERKLNHYSTGFFALIVTTLAKFGSYSYYGFKFMYFSEISTYEDLFPESMEGTFLDLGYYDYSTFELKSGLMIMDVILFFLIFVFTLITCFGCFTCRYNKRRIDKIIKITSRSLVNSVKNLLGFCCIFSVNFQYRGFGNRRNNEEREDLRVQEEDELEPAPREEVNEFMFNDLELVIDDEETDGSEDAILQNEENNNSDNNNNFEEEIAIDYVQVSSFMQEGEVNNINSGSLDE